MPVAMTEPSQHFWNNTGEALSDVFMMLKSLTLTLPVLAPVPVPTDVLLLAPQLNDIRSISFMWLAFCDSPSTPSSFKNASYAMIDSPGMYGFVRSTIEASQAARGWLLLLIARLVSISRTPRLPSVLLCRGIRLRGKNRTTFFACRRNGDGHPRPLLAGLPAGS